MKKYLLFIALITLVCSGTFAQNFRWAKQIEPSLSFGIDIIVDSQSNIYTLGAFRGTIDIDPGKGVYNLFSPQEESLYISKMDSDGNFMWAKQIIAFTSQTYLGGRTIILDKLGNIYVFGTFTGMIGTGNASSITATNTDLFLLKLSPTGSPIRLQQFKGSTGHYNGNCVAFDNTGNIYLTGMMGTSLDADPGFDMYQLTSAGETDAFTIKLDTGGNFLWAKNYGGLNIDYAISMAIDNSGYIYSTGSYGRRPYRPDDTVITSAPDVFITKMDTAGNIIWDRSIGGKNLDDVSSLAIDNTGNILLTGYFADSADFDPGPDKYTLVTKGRIDIFIAKIDTAGSLIWAKNIGSETDKEQGMDIVVDALGGIYATGIINGFSYVDSLNHNRFDAADIFVLKMDSSGNILWNIITESTTKSNNSALAICVNKSSDVFVTGQFEKSIDFNSGVNSYSLTTSYFPHAFILKIESCHLSIVQQPTHQYSYGGEKAQFIARASVTATYQWQQDTGTGFANLTEDTLYSGVTNDTLMLNNVHLSLSNSNYRCIAIDGICTDTSDIAPLTVDCNLTITTQPINQSAIDGDNALFSIAASSATANFQWQQDTGTGFVNLTEGTLYSGVTNDTLMLTNTPLSLTNSFHRCIVTNGGCADTSDIVQLTVSCNLTIATQPINQSITDGDDAHFISIASSAIASHQWQQNTGTGFVNLTEDSTYLGVTNDTLTITEAPLFLDNSSYRCIVTDGNCSDTSNVVMLTVTPLTGIHEIATENGFTVYPNPATDIITIRINNLLIGASYTITDAKGISVLKGKLTGITTSIDLSKLSSGIYTIQVGLTKHFTYKIVKQ